MTRINLKLTHAEAIMLSNLLAETRAQQAQLCHETEQAGEADEALKHLRAFRHANSMHEQLHELCGGVVMGW